MPDNLKSALIEGTVILSTGCILLRIMLVELTDLSQSLRHFKQAWYSLDSESAQQNRDEQRKSSKRLSGNSSG